MKKAVKESQAREKAIQLAQASVFYLGAKQLPETAH